MRYAFIRETLADRELYGMPLSERCRILGVSTSGYYEWPTFISQAQVA